MQVTDVSRRSPVFLPPPNGNSHRSPGYVPGRIAPVRSPPPPKTKPSQKPSSDPQQGHASYSFAVGEQKREQATTQRRRSKNTLVCFAVSLLAFFIVLILMLSLTTREVIDENCPDHNPALSSWNPGHDQQKTVIIRKGDLFRLESSATVNSIIIQKGGVLVFADDTEGFKNITLRTRYILIEDGGVLHIGAAKCRYRSKATITLFGRRDEGEEVPGFGRKFIGVRAGGSLELHGTEKLSWTFLSRTLPSSGLAAGGYSFERNFSRGINLRVLDQDTAEVLVVDRFDTHESKNDSRRLHEFLKSLHPGRIVSLAVGDSAVKSLLDETKRIIADLLGSTFVYNLKYRQAWALVGVIGGGNASCSEDVREHENHDTGGQAVARREFITVDGVRFSVSAYSEWREGFPISGFQVEVVDGVMLHMKDDVQSWNPGDRVIIASTDFSMYQAEEFSLLPCPECNKYQVKIQGKPQFTHVGEIIDAIDMRAEVGVLTRNILIHGEMENSCYGNNWCQFFSYDTFGGHIKILGNFTSVHLSHIELKNMGQQVKGSYPVHFHLCGDVDERGGYRTPTYLEGLAIHHSFSRCVAVHATNGLLIKDSVGYDTLGHCFFLEDGTEQRNTLYHNLGLVTKPGTLLPTDRNDTMCTSIRNKVYGNYIPVPATDCKAVSTFWISHPNNNLISNAAAGSQDTGIWYLFHSMSTGDTHGLSPETKAELTPLGIFYNNRVHSNFKAGLFIDKGVKTTNASAADPREYLCLDNNARFRPHVDADPKKPRAVALIDSLISFKNNDLGAWVRGGDILIKNSGFADNGIGLSFASDGSFPKDVGSSQVVSESLFVGESKNYGTNGGQNKYWGVGGGENKTRTLPRNKTFPIRGFQIYDGPVHLTKSTFKHFIPTSDRYTSAVGFFLKNPWQLTPRNNISSVKFETSVSLKVFFGISGPWFEENELDGDKNSIFHDVDGSVTGYKDAYVGRMDNFLIRHPDCINVTKWNGVICSGRYSQVFIQTWGSQNLSMSIVRDEYPSSPMTLRGINSQRASFQQYQPVVMIGKSYTVHWNGSAPKETVLYLINFDKGDWIQVGLCYPPDTTFQVMSDIYQRQSANFDSMEDYGPASSLEDLQKSMSERKFFFDNSTGLLLIFLHAKHSRDGHSYCSTQGCERVKVTATIKSKDTSNCMTKAYPKYSKPPKAIIAMPPRTTTQCSNCGAAKMVFTSDPHKTYLQAQIKSLSKEEIQQGDNESFITVNGEMFSFAESGFFLVIVDACTGKVTKNTLFFQLDAKMEKYLNTGIPQRSIVLLSTRNKQSGFGSISQYLVSLGIAKAADLQIKESFAFFGFRGGVNTSWAKLFTAPAGKKLGLLEKYIPLELEEYGCTKADTPWRKDVELLKKALSKH
ncbi:cell surface hyaluronidase [Acipenser ruthenus]|uniref:cell surface hyaluronidase n=1 Tax=Acipenser ruthenus TaxID=7906 RepID=UPI0027414C73|nr:cell surface hyaluronidase [Acipenser ruthenus]XP_058881666.1 cell surface hyaluronidase [Acipenser ruthenus]XP_058881673.1 cell surface hyaluronidase [Acipenser ruthenus]